MTDTETLWRSVSSLTFRSEGDVLGRLVRPLVAALDWPSPEIHADVPVTFPIGRNSARGRKPEADLVLAPATPAPPSFAWVVLEGKRPDQNLDHAQGQAWSYTLALKAPLYVTTNGRRFQVWQVQHGKENALVFDESLEDLAANRSTLESILARNNVLTLLERLNKESAVAPEIDVREYLAAVARAVLEPRMAPRKLSLSQPSGETSFEWPDDIRSSVRIQLNAISGRGKSMCLQMAIQRFLGEDFKLLPVRISLRPWHRGGLVELVRSELSHYLTSGATLSDARRFLRERSPLICLDDWDRATEECRSQIVRELAAPEFARATILTASRSPDSELGAAGFAQLTLGSLSKEEQGQIIDRRLGELGVALSSAGAFWRTVPASLIPVLSEPIFLSRALDLLELSPFKGVSLPRSAGDLLDEMFRAATAKVGLVGTQIDIAAQALELASSANVPFALADLSSNLSSSTQEMAVLTDALVQCGVLARARAGEFEYAHDVWSVYFQVRREARSVLRESDAVAWVARHDVPSLRQKSLLMAACVRAAPVQAALLAALLATDLQSYFSALRGRVDTIASSEHQEDFDLGQILAGHVEFIEHLLPTLRWAFSPWRVSDPVDWRMNPQIQGSVDEHAVSYRLFLGDDKPTTNADLMKRGFASFSANLASTGVRRDSGRLLAARAVLKEASDMLRGQPLPATLWTTSERLRATLFELYCYDVRKKNPDNATARSVARWASAKTGKIRKADQSVTSDNDIAIGRHGKVWLLSEISTDAQALIRFGAGDTPLRDLGLPGPDLEIDRSARFIEFYSHDQRRRRLKMLFEAICKTYRSLCESTFAGMSSEFFFGRGPVVAVVYLPKDSADWVTWWWSPAKTWSETTRIVDETSPSEDVLFDEMRNAYAAAGRDTSRLGVTHGSLNWAPYDAVVSEMVGRLLRSDFERLSEQLGAAR